MEQLPAVTPEQVEYIVLPIGQLIEAIERGSPWAVLFYLEHFLGWNPESEVA